MGVETQSDQTGGSGDVAAVARLVAQTCGIGATLVIGSGEGHLVGGLLRYGVDASGVDGSEALVARSNLKWPGRFRSGTVLALPYADGQFQTLVAAGCLERLGLMDVNSALSEMYRVSSQFVFLQIATTSEPDGQGRLIVEGRAWWEDRCFAARFRKHPAYYQANPYESLNGEPPQLSILLEKIPEASFLDPALESEHLLHRDMLRETGRRSDAHCIRYVMAAEYIRPGDTVLDVACGLGYGSHLLHHNSQACSVLGVDLSAGAIAYAESNYAIPGHIGFRAGDAENLAFIADNSVDFIAAFETIEHVPNPLDYLSELKRILKPSGRVMVCAPNYWADETGKDPNPHHLHVYTWDRLREECSGKFLVEKSFLQIAGGAMKCHHSPRRWQEVDPYTNPPDEAEWALFLCMQDPLEGADVPYDETVWQLPGSEDFHVSAFARDYANPWLVKGMVAIGFRNQSARVLEKLQHSVLATQGNESADFGAALCGLVYGKLAQPYIGQEDYEALIGRLQDYARIANPTPHQLRWQVSLLFAGGELARLHGNFSEARSLYEACAGKDVMAYSPLLGNRVLDALHWLAMLAIGAGDLEQARSSLLRAISECQRLSSGSWLNISGDAKHPLPFGYAEMAQLMDKGSRAAYMLEGLDHYNCRPKAFLAQASGFFERQLTGLAQEQASKEAAVIALNGRIAGLDHANRQLASDVAHQYSNAQELAREVTRLDAHAQALAREVGEKDRQAQMLAQEVRHLREEIKVARIELETLKTKNGTGHGRLPGQHKPLWRRILEQVKRK
ncbi:MAG: SAM-dependent methyltransferase [Methylobacter sp.]|nr:MAG: SAM-dependent methyltransferase [Methylobacter sp.]